MSEGTIHIIIAQNSYVHIIATLEYEYGINTLDI